MHFTVCPCAIFACNSCAEKPRERNSGEIFRRHGRKTWRKSGEKLRRFSSFDFQENWPQEISRKILGKFHEPPNRILSPRDSGRMSAQALHGFWAFFRPLSTPVSTAPFFPSLSVHGLHFTVYAPSNVGALQWPSNESWKRGDSKAFTAIRTVFGLAIRIASDLNSGGIPAERNCPR